MKKFWAISFELNIFVQPYTAMNTVYRDSWVDPRLTRPVKKIFITQQKGNDPFERWARLQTNILPEFRVGRIAVMCYNIFLLPKMQRYLPDIK